MCFPFIVSSSGQRNGWSVVDSWLVFQIPLSLKIWEKLEQYHPQVLGAVLFLLQLSRQRIILELLVFLLAIGFVPQLLENILVVCQNTSSLARF